MQAFLTAHATHPDAHMALALAAAQIDARRAARQPAFAATLGLVYLTEAYAAQADALLAELQQRWPGVHWVGSVGVGVMAGGVEYIGEPALVLMLCDLPVGSFQVFSGRVPLAAGPGPGPDASTGAGFQPQCALVHADPATHDLDDLLVELAGRTASGYLFGGLSASRTQRLHIADGVFQGGLSGVAFAPSVAIVSRVTQGCQPLGPTRHVTAADHNLALTLDDQPALPLLLAELGISLQRPQQAMTALRATLVGLTDPDDAALSRGGQFGADTRVRHLIGLDPARQGIAIADQLVVGQQLAFCRRDVTAARRDLVRICAEIRDELEVEAPVPQATPAPGPVHPAEPLAAPRIVGAVYVSCSGRGGPHFGGPSAEALIVQHALGDVPLVGFFAAGEIARHHLYGYTGVLTVFTTGPA
jgi:small ligand-binding sensory domain FIST